MNHLRIVCLALVVTLFATTASAGNWPRFRGPNGSGVDAAAQIPAQWDQGDFAWKAKLPGKGNSSPIVWGGNVYVTSADESSNTYSLLAYAAADGKLLWRNDREFKPMRVNRLNGFATSTPSADERGVYAMSFGSGESHVMAVSHEGESLWSVDLGGVASLHGPSLSPTVVEGKLVFSLEQEGRNRPGYWYALDCVTGETVWRIERESNGKASSSVPCVYRSGDGATRLLFSSFGHGISAVNADTGEVLWDEPSALVARAVGSPIVTDGLVLAACGRRGGGLRMSALQLDGTPRTVHAFEDRFVPYVPTPVAHEGLVYTFSDSGTVSCVNLESGELVWSERVRAKFAASPVIAGGKLFCPTMDGEVMVFKTGTVFEQLGENALGEPTQSSPAIAGGRMFVRTETQLFCVAGADSE